MQARDHLDWSVRIEEIETESYFAEKALSVAEADRRRTHCHWVWMAEENQSPGGSQVRSEVKIVWLEID